MAYEDMNSTQDEEFDYSGDGVPAGEYELTITDFDIVTSDKGTQHKLTFEAAGLPFPISSGYWVEHSNPKAVAAGRSQLKRIAQAALGQPKYTAATIKGATLLGTVSEDDAGFTRVGKFKPVNRAAAVPSEL